MRQNIRIDYSYQPPYGDGGKSLFFYSHWDGDGPLKEKLKQALIRGIERWDDESYLARIIFSEMTKEDIDSLTSYGIAPYETDPQFPTIVVNMKEKTVDGLPFTDFIRT